MRILLTALLCATALVAADVSRPMQRFILPDSRGVDHDSNQYRGKVILLEFMQTGCPHCAAFTNVLKQVQARYGPNVYIIGVVNPPDTPSNVSNFIAQHHITYPILLDAGRVAYAYIGKPEFDLPYLVVIDASGQIRHQYEYGPTTQQIFDGNALLAQIQSLLGPPAGAKK